MAPQRVTLTVPRDTALPGDESVNTFHFSTGLGGGVFTEAESVTVADLIRDFFTVQGPDSVNSLNTYMSQVSNPAAAVIRFYDLNTPEPRIPYQEHTRNLGPFGGGAPMAEEVALCLSYRTDLVSGTNQARRRGRLFIGPLAASAAEVSNGRSRPTTAMRTTLLYAGRNLQNGIRGIGLNNDWVIWSPTDQEEHVISHLWVDDAWDTMRSRGPKASLRQSVNV